MNNMPAFFIDPTWVIAISLIILAIVMISHLFIVNRSFKAAKEKAEANQEQTNAIIALKDSLDSINGAINKLACDFMSAEDRHKQIEKIIRERNINTIVKTHKAN
jgi:biopolymer transport protein ExbB/TolQ